MGKSWDSFVPGPAVWKEALRVLKPGGHLLCFAGSRTVDLMGMAIRLGGFEIRDQLQWLYGCLSDDTEILTENGWRLGTEVEVGDVVAQWDPSTEAITLVPVERKYLAPWDGSMVKFKNRDTDQLVTPNHRMPQRLDGGAWGGWVEAGECDGPLELPLPDGESTKVLEVTRQHYIGMVWCVTVPSGAFVARRNGQMFVTGNSGFPKSLDVSKAIDKAAGAATPEAQRWEGFGTALKPANEPIILARKPLSVDGRKATVVANVLAHGTGALNIDATRIAANGDKLGGGAETKTSSDQKGNEGWTRPWMDDPEQQEAHAERVRANVVKAQSQGRWPANVLLSHCESDEDGNGGCVEVGTKKVKGSTLNQVIERSKSKSDTYAGGKSQTDGYCQGYTDADGMEDVAAWECVEDCPVRLLDEQSGDRPGMKDQRNINPKPGEFFKDLKESGVGTDKRQGFNDKGGASRFFYNAKPDTKGRRPANVLLSHDEDCEHVGTRTERVGGGAKASKTDTTTVVFAEGYDRGDGWFGGDLISDVWECVEDCPVRLLDEQSGVVKGAVSNGKKKGSGFHENFGSQSQVASYADKGGASRFFYNAKTARSERDAGLPEGMKNIHPTVKPVEVMRWLVRMVTPPEGIVFDPFMGSGTTGIAAARERVAFVGADLDPEGHHLPIAVARVRHAHKDQG
jgi:hypothetical protein